MKVCIVCDNVASWERHTQFSGSHPYCDGCAREEKDFGKSDPSYFGWHEVEVDVVDAYNYKVVESIKELVSDSGYPLVYKISLSGTGGAHIWGILENEDDVYMMMEKVEVKACVRLFKIGGELMVAFGGGEVGSY